MYNAKDCTNENVYKSQLEGRYLILKEEFFKPEFRLEKYQLVLCTGGFGSDPSKIGNAIYVREINDNPESYRIQRCDHNILGIAKDTTVAAHKKKFLVND